MRQEFTKFSFKIWDLFSNFTADDPVAYIRISLYDPNFFMPSQSNYEVKINMPPLGGNITIVPASGFAISTDFTINVDGFVDEHVPITFKYIYYQSLLDQQAEIISGNAPVGVTRNCLTDFTNQQ